MVGQLPESVYKRVDDVRIPRLLKGWVTDDAHVLSPAQLEHINQMAQSLEDATGTWKERLSVRISMRLLRAVIQDLDTAERSKGQLCSRFGLRRLKRTLENPPTSSLTRLLLQVACFLHRIRPIFALPDSL
jgi:hypothetical protein